MTHRILPFVALALVVTVAVVSSRHYLRVSELDAEIEALEEATRKLCEAGHLEHAYHVNARNAFARNYELFADRHGKVVSSLETIKEHEPRVREALLLLAEIREAVDTAHAELADTHARYDELMQPFRRYASQEWGWP